MPAVGRRHCPRLRLVPALGCGSGAHGAWSLAKRNSITGMGVIDSLSPGRACSQPACQPGSEENKGKSNSGRSPAAAVPGIWLLMLEFQGHPACHGNKRLLCMGCSFLLSPWQGLPISHPCQIVARKWWGAPSGHKGR